MIPILSLVTSVKDYFEVVHKLVEFDIGYKMSNLNYSDLGNIITYLSISLKNGFTDLFNLTSNIWSLPIIVPDISSAMISEISVFNVFRRALTENTTVDLLNTYHNAFKLVETSNNEGINLILGLEKFSIGFLNSLFLCLPTSTAHIIIGRRFVMQGLEAGYMAGLGTIAGNLLWLASVVLGWRFFVIPWLSLDIFRYVLGFVLLVKYMWDSTNERSTYDAKTTPRKIFMLNFLLALTEQTSVYPFISNLSFSAEASLLESFPAENTAQFWWLHVLYLAGIGVGSFSLLQINCWLWAQYGSKIPFMSLWDAVKQKFETNKVPIRSTSATSSAASSKFINFIFLYLTMTSAITSIPYYGLDYTITNPLGYAHDDRIIQDKQFLFTSFLGTKASDRNTRRNPGRHGRRERWKRRVRKYRTFDASLYDQGIYDLFTVEDLNYGFDRFWLRRKLRNHHVKFKIFPGPWMRSFKKQLLKPRLETFSGPFIEFYRILFEQVYHPAFHKPNTQKPNTDFFVNVGQFVTHNNNSTQQNATLRKFVRNVDNRLKNTLLSNKDHAQIPDIYYKNAYPVVNQLYKQNKATMSLLFNKKDVTRVQANNHTVKRLLYQSLLNNNKTNNKKGGAYATLGKSLGGLMLHPLKAYQRKEQAFQRKLRYYTPSVFRKFSVENNAPHFRVMMRRFFYNFKQTNRWHRTMKVASLRKARRKTTRTPRKLLFTQGNTPAETRHDSVTAENTTNVLLPTSRITKPTHSYSVVSKRASRYRYQIFKDVLQHWYYSPFNRFLLKVDVDSFIRRQPNALLSTAEENLLHLRRFLLSEHYNSLRWYSNMEHYRVMKARLGGGTKSFASRVYNQQFVGTFKKIRHLFNITPKNGPSVIKFDAPLYNERFNTQSKPLLSSLVLHEELINQQDNIGHKPVDFIAESTNAVQQLRQNQATRFKNTTLSLLNNNDYAGLTRFIHAGGHQQATATQQTQQKPEAQDLYVTSLKKWKRHMGDLEALRNYTSRAVDKKEQRATNKTHKFLTQLRNIHAEGYNQTSPTVTLTSGLQKALKDGISAVNATNDTTFITSLNQETRHLLDRIPAPKERKIPFVHAFVNAINTYFSAKTTLSGVKPMTYWRHKERALGRQKRLRKKIKTLNKQQKISSQVDNIDNEFNAYYPTGSLQTTPNTSLRKKRDQQQVEVTDNFFHLFTKAAMIFSPVQSFKKELANQRNRGSRRHAGVYKKHTMKVSRDVGTGALTGNPLKTSKAFKRKQRVWNDKRSKYEMRRQKYRKRRRTILGITRRHSKLKYKNTFVGNYKVNRASKGYYFGDMRQFQPYLRSQNALLQSNTTNNIKPLLNGVSTQQEPLNTVVTLQKTSTIHKLYANIAENRFLQQETPAQSFNEHKEEVTTNMPFYAGWDEFLRKFVVTNRMLSRQDAGYQMNPLNIPGLNKPGLRDQQNIVFNQAPLQGMNAATTLYWQIPFTTYDPDQFFSLGLDGFSPIGWRKFLFRHSILKTSMNSQKNKATKSAACSGTCNTSIVVPYNKTASTRFSLFNTFKYNKTQLARHLKKRYSRVKKHPRTPVLFPSGALLNQVLPVHYIYVFYKRTRFPRDRYTLRRLLDKTDAEFNQRITSTKNSILSASDFTLRKLLKPRRVYHSLRDASRTVNPRRFVFLGSSTGDTKLVQRPFSLRKPTVDSLTLKEFLAEHKNNKTKQQNKDQTAQPLTRRVLSNTIRTVWRYRPRAGGFVWPGDYSLLELTKAPLLTAQHTAINKTKADFNEGDTTAQTAADTTRSPQNDQEIVEWQLQPKKYLYQKHNKKVLLKKFRKTRI